MRLKIVFIVLANPVVLAGCGGISSAEGNPAQTDPLTGFHRHLGAMNLSSEEALSVEWMVSVLTNKQVYDRFVSLCSDTSTKRDLEACVNEARTKLFDVHTMAKASKPSLFIRK